MSVIKSVNNIKDRVFAKYLYYFIRPVGQIHNGEIDNADNADNVENADNVDNADNTENLDKYFTIWTFSTKTSSQKLGRHALHRVRSV